MKLYLIGPQGSGKGTQAELIQKKYKLPHLSAGEMYREAWDEKTTIGKKAHKYWSIGELVPDDITIAMLKKKFSSPSCKRGYILDGSPRTLYQAQQLDKISLPDAVFVIHIPDDIAIHRIAKRRECVKCGHIGKEGDTCPCGGTMKQRQDDKPRAIRTRLKIYHKNTKPILDHYAAQGNLYIIDGTLPPKDCFKDVLTVLRALARAK